MQGCPTRLIGARGFAGSALPLALATLVVVGCGVADEDERSAAVASALSTAPKTVVRGGGSPMAGGMFFDQNNALWFVSRAGNSLTQIDPRNGRVQSQQGKADGLVALDDGTIDAAGNMYLTSYFGGDVYKRAPDGVITTLVNRGAGADAIAFDKHGRLFYARSILADELYEIDPAGVAAPRLVGSNYGFLGGFAFGTDGKLYAPRVLHGDIVKIDVNTGKLKVFAVNVGTVAAVKFDRQGRLHAVSADSGLVRRFDKNGSVTVVARLAKGLDNLAFDRSNALYVSSARDGSIWRVNTRCPVHEWKPNDRCHREVSRSGPVVAASLDVILRDGREHVIAADLASLREHAASSGDEVRGADVLVPLQPTQDTISVREGRVVTTSLTLDLVEVRDATTLASVVVHEGFIAPTNAVMFNGDLIVNEIGTGVGTGSVVRRRAGTNERVVLANSMFVPTGLATDGKDLYVTDYVSGVMWQVIKGGVVMPIPMPVVAGLAGPEGARVVADGKVLVVEALADRITEVDPATGATRVVAENLALNNNSYPGLPQYWPLNDVGVGASHLYFTRSTPNTNTSQPAIEIARVAR